MSGPDEGFLSRWSRRKRAGEEAAPDAEKKSESGSAHPRESGDPESNSLDSRVRGNERIGETGAQQEKPAEPEFDISKLPPIESITAETDIRAFLVPGVPPALTQAALRRAWVADPNIRDFIEMAENQWDFNAPGVPGFDLSAPTGDIKRMLADIMGPNPADESPAESAKAPAAEEHQRVAHTSSTNLESPAHEPAKKQQPPSNESVATPSAEPGSKNEAVRQTLPAHRVESDHAPQQNDASQNVECPITRRTHGRAMPR